jgi:hypothetical protein
MLSIFFGGGLRFIFLCFLRPPAAAGANMV